MKSKQEKKPTKSYVNTPAGLAEPREEVREFDQCRARHPKYTEAFNCAWAKATRGCGSRVVIVAGPTGVGKSTLGTSLLKQAILTSEQECADDPSRVPAILVKAIAPQGRSFSWKDFYIRALEQLREPLVQRKVWTHQQLTLLGPEVLGKTGADGMDVEVLRRSLENAVKHRKTRFVIVDEAHHMLLCQRDRQMVLQFEALKCLADACKATLVLLGTYDLLKIRDGSAQLSRRSQIVSFDSYWYRQDGDRTAFKSVLHNFAKRLPIPLAPDLINDVCYFFVKTAGCVGILHDLLRDALQEAFDAEAKEVTREIVDRVAQTNKAIQTIIEEAARGYEQLQDVALADVDALVRMAPAQIVAVRDFPVPSDELAVGPGPAPRPSAGKKPPVGQRLPARDRVGGEAHVNIF